ncbi:hemolysin-type calcium-binding region [Nostoc commune NIES-4072]|uniref:Hemolysin-type calcium-binding region n=1 Tax=Nostoc commune NIES-4072 TaxID=2005467 RepID=A0A2R5FTB7_NOSCO|nr:hypothetical protein [Nostoc commune]BBD68278.1 hemolysin-type calcium-binding region [Nostoc commune HK-02]GBG20728.1 hemolysin-type calcium-binding region [Nostoc commune NIES-4072]
MANSLFNFLNLSDLNGNNGFIINGIGEDNRSGTSVSNAGDINNDGIDDLIIGAPFASPNGAYSGQSYVVFGGKNIGSTINLTGTADADTLIGTIGNNIIDGKAGNDTLTGNGSQDKFVFRPGDGNDTITDFGGVGQGYNPSQAVIINVDQLQFIGSGLTAKNLQLTPQGNNLEVTFENVASTKVTLQNFFLENLDNLPETNSRIALGNILFDGQTSINDSFDVINANSTQTSIFNKNTVTFLNDLNNNIAGFDNSDDVINGQGGNDIINGLSGNDLLRGQEGDDILIGGFGNDTLVGGVGNDTLVGGVGANTFLYNTDAAFNFLNLSELNGNNGFLINGIAELDRSGQSVSNAGDINGDGIDDLIIGAYNASPNGNYSAGQSYVVFGGTNVGSSGSLNLSDLNGTNGFLINGIRSNDFSGQSVSNAGDINNDGIDDLIIGAQYADPNRISGAGQSYVVFGGTNVGTNGSLNLSDLNGTNGFLINGIRSNDFSGRSVSNAGDINNDGIDDLIIGAFGADPNGISGAGQSYVVFGGTNVGSGGTLNPSDLNGNNGFIINGIRSNDFSGNSVSNAGDINGDGIDDLIIGAFGADPNGISNAGQSYVVFGGTNLGSGGSLNLSDLNGTNGFLINGIAEDDYSGFLVSNAGDINGDGIDDLIIGAQDADPYSISRPGQSYVVFGGTNLGSGGSLNLSDLNGTNGFLINAIASGDSSGTLVNNAGDINNDGIDDLIIGAEYASLDGNSVVSQSYVVFGGTNLGSGGSLNLSELNGNNGFLINAIRSNDFFTSLSNAGDINNDGIDDLIIGAPFANSISGAGQSYVVFGGKNLDSGNDLLRGGEGDDTLIGGFGNNILIGDVGADRFLYNTDAAFALSAVGEVAITDFNSSQGDKIVLDKTTFSAITSAAGTGFNNLSDFEVTNLAGTSTAKIVYDPVSGQLFYNSNGSAAGFGSGGLFATLTGAPTLTASDFVLQA